VRELRDLQQLMDSALVALLHFQLAQLEQEVVVRPVKGVLLK
jgi:hypothetical protein